MALVINQSPPSYSSVHRDLLYTVYESVKANDPVTYPLYRYVCDVYVDGVMVDRLKAPVHPVHKRGVFNVASVVRNYLNMKFKSDNTGILNAAYGVNEFFVDIQCKFGEEYNYNMTTNITIDGVLRCFNHYYYHDSGASNPVALNVDDLLTNRPQKNKVGLSDPYFFVPFAISGSSFQVDIYAYDASNVLLVHRTGTIGLDADNCGQLNFSPAAVNVEFGSTITSACAYYVIEIETNEVLRLYVEQECMYEPYVLHFLNQWGGYETVRFSKKSTKSHEIEKKDFTAIPWTVNASTGAVEYGTGSVLNESKVTFASRFSQKKRISSDFLDDASFEWLRELVASPSVYLTFGTQLAPVTITNTSYEVKKRINDKLQALVVEIDFGQQNAQFR